jgi:WD40 repeat protein/tetratricopeptide (TPR) repeat protein
VSLPGESTAYYRSAAQLAAQVADALDHAHREGIIHRDVKPGNLLLDAEARVWVTDFGLAKTDGADLTQTGDIIGTIRYMAPERFRGWSDPRSDVYGLGLTLYELLALRPAFQAHDRLKLIDLVTNTEPPRLRRLDPTIPRDLETIVHKAIDKEPGGRYQTAAEMAADLRRFVEDKPILARRTGPAERAWRWCRRNPVVATLLAAVVLVTATGYATTVHQMREARANARRADDSAADAKANAHRAETSAADAKARAEEAEERRLELEDANERLRLRQQELRRNTYANQMNLIPPNWAAENYPQVLKLLEKSRPRVGEEDLRGFEWEYWKRQAHGELTAVRLQNDPATYGIAGVITVANLDGSRSVGRDATRLLSADGNRVVAHYPDGLWLWDVNSGRVVSSPAKARAPVGRSTTLRNSALSPDGRRYAEVALSMTDGFGPAAPPERPSATVTVRDLENDRDLYVEELTTSFGQPTVRFAFSHDGTRLAVSRQSPPGGGLILTVCDLTTGQRAFEPKAVDSLTRVSFLAFTPDGTQVISAEARPASAAAPNAPAAVARMVVFSANTGAIVKELPLPASTRLVAVSADGSRLAAVSVTAIPLPGGGVDLQEGTDLKVLDAGGQVLCTFNVPAGITNVCFSPDGQRLAGVAPGASTIHVWDSATGAELYAFRGQSAPVTRITFSPDGLRLVTLDAAGTVKTWDLTARPDRVTLPTRTPRGGGASYVTIPDPLTSFHLTPDGRRSMVVLPTRVLNRPNEIGPLKITIHDESGQVLRSFERPAAARGTRGSRATAFSPDGAKFAAFVLTTPTAGHPPANSQPRPTWVVWDVAANKQVCELAWPGGRAPVTAITVPSTFSPDGQLLAIVDFAGDDRVVSVFDALTGAFRNILRTADFIPAGLAFSPDGRQLAVSGNDANGDQTTVRVFDMADATEQTRFMVPQRMFLDGLMYSPNGRWLTGYSNNLVRAPGRDAFSPSPEIYVWDTWADESEPRALAGQADIKDHAISPDSRRLATCGLTQAARPEIKVWDLLTGQELLTLPSKGPVQAVRFSADGLKLYAFDGAFRHAYHATPLLADLEAQDVADHLPPAATKAEAVAHLDRPKLSPEVKARALELARLTPTVPGRRGWAAGTTPSGPLDAQVPAIPGIIFRAGLPDADYRRALASGEDGRVRLPGSQSLWLRYAGALYRLGEYQKALDALTHVRELEQRQRPTQYLATTAFLAMTYYRLNQPEKSKEELARLRREMTDESFAYQSSLELYRTFYAEAQAVAEGRPFNVASPARALTAGREIYLPDLAEPDYNAALDEAGALKTATPTNAVAWVRYGGALYRLGRYQDAIEPLLKARAMGGLPAVGSLTPTAFLAMTYHRLGQPAKAQEELARLRREMQEEPFASSLKPDLMHAFCAEPAALIEGKK